MMTRWLVLLAMAFPIVASAQGLSENAATLPTRVIQVPTDPAPPKCTDVTNDEHRSVHLDRRLSDKFLGSSLNRELWRTSGADDPTTLKGRTIPSTNEKEIYVDPGYAGSGNRPLGLNPFEFKNGVLTITTRKTPVELLDKLYNLPFTSGLIITARPFKYGYFEINARLSRGKALWPGFWLIGDEWPPEIDILEGENGEHPEQISVTTHWGTQDNHVYSLCKVFVPDSVIAFHSYGMYWSAERIVYYLDQQPVVQMKTPLGVDLPMRAQADLAVQSNGDDSSAGRTLEIDWISVYQER